MTRLHNLLSAGGGTVGYAWHVAGMPWVCTDSKALADYLETITTADYFGGVGSITHEAGNKLTYLACLDVSSTTWDWKHDDADGLSGGDFTIKVAEIQPGVDWSTIALAGGYGTHRLIGASSSFGIPGLSQVFDANNDTAIKIGELADEMGDDDTTILMKDIRGLAAYIDGYTGHNVTVWIGNECILISDITDNSDGTYTLTIPTDGRGIFRTRIQPHFLNEYSSRAEYIASAPLGGIAGRPAYLWAFPSVDRGATFGTPTLIHHGRVSQGISIRNGVATVRHTGPLSWLKAPSPTSDYVGNLRRYVLQRGNIGTLETAGFGSAQWGSNGVPNWACRAPHLVFYEKASDGAGSAKEHIVPVWLCEKNSQAEFDTWEDVLAAIQKELNLLTKASTSQLTGDGTAGNDRQELYFKYVVTKTGIALDYDSDNTTDLPIDIGAARYPCVAMCSGQLALAFGLVHKKSFKFSDDLVASFLASNPLTIINSENEKLDRTNIAKMLADPHERWDIGDRALYFGAFRADGGYVATTQTQLYHLNMTYFQHIPTRDKVLQAYLLSRGNIMEINPDLHYPKYYYEYGRDTDADTATYADVAESARSFWCVPQDSNGSRRLYLEKIEGNLPAAGTTIVIGDPKGEPRLQGTVESAGEDGEYYYVVIDSEPTNVNAAALLVPNGGRRFKGIFHAIGWIWCNDVPNDPWAVSVRAAASTSDGAIELLKAGLAASSSVTLSPHQSLHWVPEVGASTSDGYSWIDWDDFADKLVPLTDDEKYIFRPADQKYYDTFISFARSHGLIPYLELVEEAAYDLFKLRFRPIGVVNVSDAIMYGRFVSSNYFTDNYNITRDVASGFVYSAISMKLNYDNEEYGVNIHIKDKSSFAQGGYSDKTYQIEDRMTHCPSLRYISDNKSTQIDFSSRFVGAILPHISRPRPISTAQVTCRAMLLPVGGDIIISDAYGKNPFTGGTGYADLPGLVTEVSLNLGTLKAKMSWRLARSKSKGWAPALYCPANTLTNTSGYNYTVALSGSPCAADHEFSSSLGTEPTDYSRFDCWDFDRVTKRYVARACSCGDYAIKVHRADVPGASYVTGTCSVIGMEYGGTPAMTLELNGSVSTTSALIIEFGSYNDAEQCQKDLYVAYCDDAGYVGTVNDPCDVWV